MMPAWKVLKGTPKSPKRLIEASGTPESPRKKEVPSSPLAGTLEAKSTTAQHRKAMVLEWVV